MDRDVSRDATTGVDVGVAPPRDSATSDSAAVSEAPRDEVERRLLEMWRWILDIPDIGVRDNFYDLVAAHYPDNRLIEHSSRRALTLFTVIEEKFRKILPMATLMDAPTIEQLAAVLRRDDFIPSWASLVPIQSGGSKPPFFIIHGKDAHVNFAYYLARLLAPEQPFYGLQSQGLDGNATLHTRIEDMAAHYVREIRGLQPQGPYYLGGKSMGGGIAFETAQQLLDQGEGVALLVMFDSVSPTMLRNMRERDPIGGRARVERHMRNLSGSKPTEKVSYVLRGIANVARRQKTAVGRKAWRTANGFYQGIGLPLPGALRDIKVANTIAYRNYVPREFPGKITLLRAREQPGVGTGARNRRGVTFKRYDHSRDLDWGVLAGGGVEIHDVPGNHDDMYYAPHVGALAEKLSACLCRAQACGTVAKRDGAA